MDQMQQVTALVIAHRAILAYLVKVVAQLPSEAGAADPTVTMLRNSLPAMFAGIPDALAVTLVETAGTEIDRIFTAPFRPAPAAE